MWVWIYFLSILLSTTYGAQYSNKYALVRRLDKLYDNAMKDEYNYDNEYVRLTDEYYDDYKQSQQQLATINAQTKNLQKNKLGTPGKMGYKYLGPFGPRLGKREGIIPTMMRHMDQMAANMHAVANHLHRINTGNVHGFGPIPLNNRERKVLNPTLKAYMNGAPIPGTKNSGTNSAKYLSNKNEYYTYYYYENELENPLKWFQQKWFNFKMSLAEKILMKYIIGSQTMLQREFHTRLGKFDTAIDKYRRSSVILQLTPSAWIDGFKSWVRQTAIYVFNHVKQSFKVIVVKGYNMAKKHMANERGLKAKELKVRDIKEPKSQKGKNFITRFLQRKAFNIAVRFVNSAFNKKLANFEKELKVKAERWFKDQIEKYVPIWKIWVEGKLNDFFDKLIEYGKVVAKVAFNQAKEAIATGMDIKYDRETLNVQARIEYLNQMLRNNEYYDEYFEW